MICEDLEKCIARTIKGEEPEKCNNRKDECIESSDERSSVKCEEKKKRYILNNTRKKHVVSYKMDGGIICLDATVPAQTPKCDYLYVVEGERPAAILVELKGVDVRKAMGQIDSTLMLFPKFFRSCSNVYGRIVVSSSIPRLKAEPSYLKLQRKLMTSYGGNLKIQERQLEEKDTELDKVKP